MRRRRLLATLAATGSASLLAGCADRVPIGSGSSPDSGTATGAPTGSPASPSVSATEARTGTGAENESASCPAVGSTVVCYRSAPPDAPVVLVPSMERVSLAGEFVGFTLYNRSDSEIAFRPYGWQVWRRLDGWHRVNEDSARESIGETVLSSGGSYGWQVAVGPVTAEADRPPVTVNDVEFEPGRYAFAVPARRDEGRTYVAAFDVTG